MSKQRSFQEFTVEVEGVAIIPFTRTLQQTAGNAEQAAKLVRKRVKNSRLNQLDPLTRVRAGTVKTVSVRQVTVAGEECNGAD